MKKNPVLLCVDIGTSSLKAAFIKIEDDESRLAALSRIEYPKDIYSAVCETGRPVKLPSAEWEAALKLAIVSLLKDAPAVEIKAVCISGNGPTLVPVDSGGEALLTLHWFGKTSAAAQVKSFFLPHVLWFMEKYPECFFKSVRIFSCQEWLSYKLGAEAVTTLPAEGYRPFYWDERQCAALGIDIALFPRFAYLGEITGKISHRAAMDFSLPQGIPVVAGGPDFIMALLGAGVIRPGLVCDRAGSSEGVNVCITESEALRIAASGARVRILPHVIENLWNASVVLPESGSIFEHWREETGQINTDYDEILAKIIPDDPAAPVHPVLLKITSQLNEALSKLEESGLDTSKMRLSGGQAKNRRWNALKARLTGRRLFIPEILDAELAGNAACALCAIGEASSLAEACERVVKIKTEF
ncbi:MAG: FGGY-family carbohydrate kinase [Termitinemataceae bacterium]|nr:MAG: FGGY-family carbohydrate kinase [Termitinemataceae bacterium]